MYTVNKATLPDIEKVSKLYKEYLSFYEVDITDKNPKQYLIDRLTNNESVIYFVQDENNNYVGFMQLYPLFCSLGMSRTWLLYDLFVTESSRCHGIAKLLLDQADKIAEDTNASFIMLSTAVDNLKAQKLYEKNGYEKDIEFLTYLKHSH
ncbi:GNAT family N-acetyltransferase [Photobacterium phosphoreum]|uniref:GNAT family N-acetyltransferase n=2 Tax=Photobacterium phosphoreum TaxID=659 RepID=A0A2T3JTF4_PHOPO|nr:GNAT family N-acetyltransferase [Photobacterium phosphoreum]PSU21259.1 GNAT family N-acetyltransferase [Photobacterium phosphoreum]PSU52427.1 GNAT family N-acetyltransferase [Photobacterium phosphoreum]